MGTRTVEAGGGRNGADLPGPDTTRLAIVRNAWTRAPRPTVTMRASPASSGATRGAALGKGGPRTSCFTVSSSTTLSFHFWLATSYSRAASSISSRISDLCRYCRVTSGRNRREPGDAADLGAALTSAVPGPGRPGLPAARGALPAEDLPGSTAPC